ncbi:MAG TPA: hypothetical protein VI316_01490 [Candidatus Dormibacteraeota bacterium]
MRRHHLDVISLVAGVTFITLGALLIGDQVDLVVRLRWGWPLLLIAVAAVMLASVGVNRGAGAAVQTRAAPTPGPGGEWVSSNATAGEAAAMSSEPLVVEDPEGR